MTGETRQVQQSEGLDILGIGADEDRALPSSFNSLKDNDIIVIIKPIIFIHYIWQKIN